MQPRPSRVDLLIERLGLRVAEMEEGRRRCVCEREAGLGGWKRDRDKTGTGTGTEAEAETERRRERQRVKVWEHSEASQRFNSDSFFGLDKRSSSPTHSSRHGSLFTKDTEKTSGSFRRDQEFEAQTL